MSTAAWMSLTSRPTLRSPSSVAMALGDPGVWSGWMNLASSSHVPPAGKLSPTISVLESGMPHTVSMNSPSMTIRSPASNPSATKNSVTASRSATVIPT